MFCSRCGTEAQVSTRFCPTCGLDLSALTQGLTTSAPAAAAAAAAAQPDEAEMVRDALKDEYEIEKELGRGGMAIVFKARDKSLERDVAIKVLPFSLSFDAEFVERFQREARTAGKLEHPNVIPIYRVGKAGRVIYFVMKFIRGKSLSSVIEARGALPVPEIKRVLIECLRGLGFAHKHGIVHRDIKPDNIMFDELGQAIVTDFGIAKAQSGARLTGTGMSIGTPHYMSPEQARAQNLDGRSDIYSLGVVGYQCLTGHVPFDGEDSFSIGYKHIMEELPTPPLETAEQRDLFTIVQKMMAKKADDRWQSCEEAVQALEHRGGASARVSMTEVATMPTRAIEPVKAPPPMSMAATTPLPRASASMMKAPADAAAGAAGAAPPAEPSAPAKGKPAPKFQPKAPAPKAKSKAPFYALAAVAVIGVGLGAFVVFGRGAPAPTTPVAADSTPPTVATADSTRAAGDTSRSGTTSPAPGARTPPGTTTPAGPDGTLSLEGNIPAGARFTADGRPITRRQKLAPGRYRIRVEAAGYQAFTATVAIAPSQTLVQAVTLQATTSASTTPAPGGTQPPGGTTPAANCSNPSFGLLNQDRACYDTRPTARSGTSMPPPESCTGTVTPANVMLQVSPTGDVVTASPRGSSSCPAFTDAAVAFARDLMFNPATKGGQPVSAWVAQLIRPLPR